MAASVPLLKKGDIVKVKPECISECGSCRDNAKATVYIEITDVNASGLYDYRALDANRKPTGYSCYACYKDKHLEIDSISQKYSRPTIMQFIRNLTLSSDEKLMRKHGLKNDRGEYTTDAREAVTEKLVRDNQQYLIEIARGMESLEAKKK